MPKNNPFYMAGTEGTGKYIVIATTARGRIGLRVFEGDPEKVTSISAARIRVEPPATKPKVLANMAGVLTLDKGWKQPGQQDQHRFSTVVHGTYKVLKNRLEKGLSALRAGELKTEVNPEAPAWAKNLVAALS